MQPLHIVLVQGHAELPEALLHRLSEAAGGAPEVIGWPDVMDRFPDPAVDGVILPFRNRNEQDLTAKLAVFDVAVFWIVERRDTACLALASRSPVAGCLTGSMSPLEMASVLRLGIDRSRELRRLAERVSRLESEIDTRKLLERAKGVLMERWGLTEEEARRRLVRQAAEKGRPVAEIARGILMLARVRRD